MSVALAHTKRQKWGQRQDLLAELLHDVRILLVEAGPVRADLSSEEELKDILLTIDEARVLNPKSDVSEVLGPGLVAEKGAGAPFKERDEDR